MARDLIDTNGAAELLGVAPATLRSWRYRGKGPPYRKVGGIRATPIYAPEEVEMWALNNPTAPTQAQEP